MSAAIAHGNKYIVLLKPNHRLIDELIANVQLLLGVIIDFIIPQHNNLGIIVLNYLRGGIVDKMNYCKR